MSNVPKFSDYDGATPYEFLSWFIQQQDETEFDETEFDEMYYYDFYLALLDNDNIEVLEGSELGTLMKILYDAGYTTSSSNKYPRFFPKYFLKVHMYNLGDGNIEWKIEPMGFYEGVYEHLLFHLRTPGHNRGILDPEIAEELASEGTLDYLLDKSWTTGEILDLLTWIAREGKVISPDNYTQPVELSPPRYKKSGRK